MLFEFCGTYFGTNKGELGTMFEASVRDDFFEDKDEKSYSVLELCNISDALEDDKEELEHRLRILQGLTQESTQKRLDKVFQAIKIECEEEDTNLLYTLTLYCHVF